ncbi:MAG: hypothetical protein Q4C95_02165 [Planctomycetia bacterium]|nr:hypothetical protein [Planctomycetia bacterium]
MGCISKGYAVALCGGEAENLSVNMITLFSFPASLQEIKYCEKNQKTS